MSLCAPMEDRVEDLLEAGVLDPAKVTRSGLTNACGIAGIMLTTQARCLSQKPSTKSCSSPCNLRTSFRKRATVCTHFWRALLSRVFPS